MTQPHASPGPPGRCPGRPVGSRPRRGARHAGFVPILVLAGCCSIPEAGRYFDLHDPWTTVNAFVYAVEAGQWDFAYSCLTDESQEAIEKTRFKLFLLFGEHPDFGIPLQDIILEARRDRRFLHRSRDAGVWIYLLVFDGEDAEGRPLGFQVDLALVNTEPESEWGTWKIDFDRLLRKFGQAP